MTHAVCINCGAMKWGAFTTCAECGGRPKTKDEFTDWLALTDHYMDDDKLKTASKRIRKSRAQTPPTGEDEQR